MDLVKLLADSSGALTQKISPEKAILVKLVLEQNRIDIGHILTHLNSISADGKLTVADIPDIVMFCVELFTFISSLTQISFSKDDIFTLAENAVIIIIAAPTFAMTEPEIKIAVNVADTCFMLAKKVIKGTTYCSRWCIWPCCRRPTPKHLTAGSA
jgi:hypothetical protein